MIVSNISTCGNSTFLCMNRAPRPCQWPQWMRRRRRGRTVVVTSINYKWLACTQWQTPWWRSTCSVCRSGVCHTLPACQQLCQSCWTSKEYVKHCHQFLTTWPHCILLYWNSVLQLLLNSWTSVVFLIENLDDSMNPNLLFSEGFPTGHHGIWKIVEKPQTSKTVI